MLRHEDNKNRKSFQYHVLPTHKGEPLEMPPLNAYFSFILSLCLNLSHVSFNGPTYAGQELHRQPNFFRVQK